MCTRSERINNFPLDVGAVDGGGGAVETNVRTISKALYTHKSINFQFDAVAGVAELGGPACASIRIKYSAHSGLRCAGERTNCERASEHSDQSPHGDGESDDRPARRPLDATQIQRTVETVAATQLE